MQYAINIVQCQYIQYKIYWTYLCVCFQKELVMNLHITYFNIYNLCLKGGVKLCSFPCPFVNYPYTCTMILKDYHIHVLCNLHGSLWYFLRIPWYRITWYMFFGTFMHFCYVLLVYLKSSSTEHCSTTTRLTYFNLQTLQDKLHYFMDFKPALTCKHVYRRWCTRSLGYWDRLDWTCGGWCWVWGQLDCGWCYWCSYGHWYSGRVKRNC